MASPNPQPAVSIPKTLVEKVIARAAASPQARAGDIVTVNVDLAFGHEGSGPRRWQPVLDELQTGVWDPNKVAVVIDHYVPAASVQSAEMMRTARAFVERHGIRHFLDSAGISHVVLAERGLIRPGSVIAGGDSHSPMAGAFGTYAAGYGMTDMCAIVATGQTWVKIPKTIRVEFSGALGTGVTAKDIMLFLCRRLGMANAFRAIEYGGPLIEGMTMSERMVLCNMATELGCETGVVAPDSTTFDYLEAAGRPVEDRERAAGLTSDEGADYEATYRFDADELVPQVAAPHSPENSGPVADFEGVKIDQGYIGACVGAKLDDLRAVARVLRGRRVKSRLLVAPASTQAMQTAAGDGTLETILSAGATLLASGCGACAGLGAGVLAGGETCISSTNRNFKGRMGSAEAAVYLGSPYSVAAAAVAGKIVDPRPMIAGPS